MLEKVSYRESPDGWIGVMETPGCPLDRLDPGPQPLILVCESVEKPGNLGAMLRTAEAAGVSAVISAEAVTDWGNPNVVRASKGTVFTVPVAVDSSAAVLAWLRRHHAAVVVTTPDGTCSPAQVDLTSPTAVVIGSESSGVTPLWRKEADAAVRIPMYGSCQFAQCRRCRGHCTVRGEPPAPRRRGAGGMTSDRPRSADRDAMVSVRRRTVAGSQAASIPRRGQSATPLSWAQQRIWFQDRLAVGDVLPGYTDPNLNTHFSKDLIGPLDAAVLREAFRQIASRHRPLHAVLVTASADGLQTEAPDRSPGLRSHEPRR